MDDLNENARKLILAQNQALEAYEKEIAVKDDLIKKQKEIIEYQSDYIERLKFLIDQFPRS